MSRRHGLPIRAATLAAAILGLAVPLALADTVIKTDGTKVEGKIIENTADHVLISTKLGEIKIPKSDIRTTEEGKTLADQFKDKWEAVDKADAIALAELAEWCDENKLSRESKKVWRAILDVDPDDEGARRALGYVKVDGEWKSKADLDAEKKAAELAKAKADKEKAAKAKPEKGKTAKGKPAGTSGEIPMANATKAADFPETKSLMESGDTDKEKDQQVATDFGQGVLGTNRCSVMSSARFKLFTPMPPDDTQFHLALAERCAMDCNRMFGLDPEQRLWNEPFLIFHVKQKGSYNDLVDWLDSHILEFKPEEKKFFKEGGGLLAERKPLAALAESGVPLKNAIPQWTGKAFIVYYTGGAARLWLREGFAMYVAVTEFGVSLLTFVDQSKYENAVEVADKNSDTAYRLVCQDLIAGKFSDVPHAWNDIREKGLNQLDYVDLAKCWSICDFLMQSENRENFMKYLAGLRSVQDEEQALQSAFGWSGKDLDDHWATWVKETYKDAPVAPSKQKPDPKKKKTN